MNELIEQVCNRIFPHDYSAGTLRVTAEREGVHALLSSTTAAPVYGFTTLLGHLDHLPVDSDSQSNLLQSHLVGPTIQLPGEWAEVAIRVKLANLALGGSGIHPQTFQQLIDVAITTTNDPAAFGDWKGSWTASYGSGDVVPGAWLVHELMSKVDLQLAHPGDLIALINGHFMSTTAALLNSVRFLSLSYEALRALAETPRPIESGTQLPVTLRDVEPLAIAVDAALTNLFQSILRRVSSQSANPLFQVRGGSLRAISQSSFLDFTLTAALSGALQATAQICAYVKAAVLYVSRRTPEASVTKIQNIKILEDSIREISSLVIPTNFSLAESNGIEDVGDQSLRTARLFGRALSVLDSALTMHSQAVDQPRSHTDLTPALTKIHVAAQKASPLLDF